jgi:hypothetical protein
LVLQVAVKIKFKSASRATGWNVDIKKLLVIKTSSWTWIDFLWREELYDG